MPKTGIIPIPVRKTLEKLGEDIRYARIRRRIPMDLMAKRAGITKPTLIKIEKGDVGTSIGVYTKVLFILGLNKNLADIADIRNDPVGIMIANNELPKRVKQRKSTDNY